MAQTQELYEGDGTTRNFTFPFEYIKEADIKVSLNGSDTTEFTFANATTIQFNVAPPDGAAIRIYRVTDIDNAVATFFSGSSIRAQDLNNNADQLLYATQETVNRRVDSTGGSMTGNLDMNGNKIVDLGAPTNDQDAVTKFYIDTRLGAIGIPGHTRWRKTATASQTTFSGTGDYGGTLAYTATREQVYLNGALQQRGVDYTADNGTSIVFSVALTAGDIVDIVCVNNLNASTVADAANINYGSQFTGQTTRTVAAKLADVVSVKDFGAVGDGVTSDWAAVTAAWNYCLANGKDLYFPAGTYVSTAFSFQIGRIDGSTPSSLLDCKNITVFGDGKATILKTITATGADVLQLNGAKNLHIRDLSITAELTDTSGAGSNAISITAGGSNLTFNNIYAFNLPYVPKTSPNYLDGGKGFTLQLGGSLPLETITFTNCIADGCTYGFDFNPATPNYLLDKSCVVRIENSVAENCWYGFVASAAAATAAVTDGFNSGLVMHGSAVNCQHGIAIGRMHGGDFRINVVNSKSKSDLTLDPNGTAWSTTLNTLVECLDCRYAHNAKIQVTGYANVVDHKARIGGASQGSSGLTGATNVCDIYLDIGGTSTVSDVAPVDSGGNTLRSSKLTITKTTSATLDSNFAIASKQNVLEVIGEYGQGLVSGNVRFPATQVQSTDANTLDDYEEGTFTPILADTSLTDEGATYSTRAGFYTKIGNVVHFNCYFAMSGLGTLTTGSNAFVLGLPYPSLSASGNISSCSVSLATGLSFSTAAIPGAIVLSGNSYVALRKTLGTSTTGDTTMLVSDIGSAGTLCISGSYRTSS